MVAQEVVGVGGAGACVGDLRPRGPGNSGCDFSPERPLHFAEKVLPILHGLGTDSYLVVKKHQSMEAMLLYLGRWRTWVGGDLGGWCAQVCSVPR